MRSASLTNSSPLRSRFVLSVFASFLVATMAGAEFDPPGPRFQGVLVDTDGVPLPGPVDVGVVIWDSEVEGNVVFGEVHLGVPLVEGVFEIIIGAGSPKNVPGDGGVFSEPDRWLEIQIGDETLSPRMRFTSVPYAGHADVANRIALVCDEGDVVRFRSGVPVCEAPSTTGGPICVAGDRVACYESDASTRGVGVCHEGIRECEIGSWGSCEGQVGPTTESCNGVDDDCDGIVDEALANGCVTHYRDADLDGVGVVQTINNCLCVGSEAAVGWSLVGGDCDDADPDTFPGQEVYFASPRPNGSYDYDCDEVEELGSTFLKTTCETIAGLCGGAGWNEAAVPACGETATWWSCTILCGSTFTERPQLCQ